MFYCPANNKEKNQFSRKKKENFFLKRMINGLGMGWRRFVKIWRHITTNSNSVHNIWLYSSFQLYNGTGFLRISIWRFFFFFFWMRVEIKKRREIQMEIYCIYVWRVEFLVNLKFIALMHLGLVSLLCFFFFLSGVWIWIIEGNLLDFFFFYKEIE